MPSIAKHLESEFKEPLSRGTFKLGVDTICEKLDRDEKLDVEQHDCLMNQVIAVNKKTRAIVHSELEGLGKKLFWAVVVGFTAFSIIFTLGQWYFKITYGMIF